MDYKALRKAEDALDKAVVKYEDQETGTKGHDRAVQAVVDAAVQWSAAREAE